ncbi:MAG: shikimate dehydrogenase [Myxococcota bacterium]|jgi:shikimate dehydrogenase
MNPITGHTAVYAVVGRPIGHSGSPALHNAWFQALGIDATYVALDVAPEDGERLMNGLRLLNLAGVNFTVPHKQAVVPHLDVVSDDVRVLGAANTAVRRGNKWHGYNTDVQGFINGFVASQGTTLAGRDVVLLGAGGAALAVAKGLCDAGVEHIAVCNRTQARAADLADRLDQTSTTFSAHPLTDGGSVATGRTLVVNALAGDGIDAAALIDPKVLGEGAVWCDLNYWMTSPPGWVACQRAGIPFVDGSAMLRHQAVLAFKHFTGKSPPPVPNRRPVE